MNKTVFFILLLMVDGTISAKILGVFMVDAFSHFNINNAIMETLAMAGHEVTVISRLKPKSPLANITYIQAGKKTPQHVSPWSTEDLKRISRWDFLKIIKAIFEEDCKQFMALKETQDMLTAKGEKFDLMLTELIYMNECFFPAARRQNIPIIATVSMDLRIRRWAFLGYPYNPSFTPHRFSACTTEITFVERLKNTIELIHFEFLEDLFINSGIKKIYQKYYPDLDPSDRRLSLLFNNNHRSIFPQLSTPSIIEIGGIHLKPQQPLPKHLEEFISGAEQGVILFSLGTIATAKDLTTETRQIFRNVFAKIPQRVIWKFGEHIDGVSDNVLISEWIPQQDILAQENVVLFISHVGKSSSIEAVSTGTPVLAIPLFYDQFSIAANLKELGIALVVDIFTLTETSLLGSLQEILQNRSYKDKARKLSQAFHDRPMTPKETVIYWTEYVLKHNGTDHLQTEEADMPFYFYLLFDVILCTAIFVTLMSILLWWVIKKSFSCLA